MRQHPVIHRPVDDTNVAILSTGTPLWTKPLLKRASVAADAGCKKHLNGALMLSMCRELGRCSADHGFVRDGVAL